MIYIFRFDHFFQFNQITRQKTYKVSKKCDYMTASLAIHVKYGRLSSIVHFFSVDYTNKGRLNGYYLLFLFRYYVCALMSLSKVQNVVLHSTLLFFTSVKKVHVLICR